MTMQMARERLRKSYARALSLVTRQSGPHRN